MLQTQIAFFLTYLVSAFPLTFAILSVFQKEIKGYDFLYLNDEGNFIAYFFFFGMAALGLFIDTFRHTIEWLIEWRLKDNQDEKEQCAFYPRLKIEDVLKYEEDLKGTNSPFSEILFERKLARYEPRYFAAEGLLSFALSCLLALGLILYRQENGGFTQKPFAMYFLFLSCPFSIIFSFLWCQDKEKFINKILGELFNNRRVILLCKKRKYYFSFFTFFYVSIILSYLFFSDFETKHWYCMFLFSSVITTIFTFLLHIVKEKPGSTSTIFPTSCCKILLFLSFFIIACLVILVALITS